MTTVEGRISKLDGANRVAVISTEDGKEVTLKFPERVNIEIAEPATMGTMGGTLEELKEGYLVEVEVEAHADGTCLCSSLVCIS